MFLLRNDMAKETQNKLDKYVGASDPSDNKSSSRVQLERRRRGGVFSYFFKFDLYLVKLKFSLFLSWSLWWK